MAVVESKKTNVIHITRDGTTIERIFTMTVDDWNDGSLGILLGDKYNSDNPNLRVSDISSFPLDNVNIEATVLYSTESTTSQARKADEVQSWEESLDFGFIEIDDDTFFSRGVTGTSAIAGVITAERAAGMVSFTSAYANYVSAASAVGIVVPSEVPRFTQRIGSGIITIKTYGSSAHIARIMNLLPTVNRNNFIQPYFTTEQGTGIVSDAENLVDDTGFWLFTGCPFSRINPTTWEYNWTFEYSPFVWLGFRMKWNEPFGFALNNYFETDFIDLFQGMTLDTEQTLLQGTR